MIQVEKRNIQQTFNTTFFGTGSDIYGIGFHPTQL